jgi:hypothetical protein
LGNGCRLGLALVACERSLQRIPEAGRPVAGHGPIVRAVRSRWMSELARARVLGSP